MIPHLSKTVALRRNFAFLMMALLLTFGFFLPQFTSNTANKAPVLSSKAASQGEKEKVVKAYGKLPIYFIPNKGQINSKVKYYATGAGYSFYLTKDEVTYSFVKNEPNKAKGPSTPETRKDFEKPKAKEAYALKIKFLGANPEAILEGQKEQKAKVNYFIGNDPKKWQTNVSTYSQVTYKNLYDGIDLIYKGDQRTIKYEFVVSPGANYKDIKLFYKGADSLKLDKKGNLLISTPWGNLKDEKPNIYQVIDGERKGASGSDIVNGDSIGFSVASYNPNYALIIDPGLTYSTFLGGSLLDSGRDLALDASGNAYVTGETDSSNFPTTAGVYDETFNGGRDVFVTKFNSTGSALSYSTFLGGSGPGADEGFSLAVDSLGNAYLVGTTSSSNFPTTAGAYDETYNSPGTPDAFVSKLSSAGNALIYSTFLGGSTTDEAQSLAVDSSGNAYVSGYTDSSNFPTTLGAFDATYNGGPEDAFISKLNPTGTGLTYSTFLGGTLSERGYTLALDASGNAYVTGETDSSNFPTTAGVYDETFNGGRDVFVTKLNSTGSALSYSTFLGGSGWDFGASLALDSSGNAYIAGASQSSNFPTTVGAYDETHNLGYDAFVTKLNASGNALIYSTFLGGSDLDSGEGSLVLDTSGNIYLSGYTVSANFPTTTGAFDESHNGGADVFVSKLNPTGSALSYSTFLGGGADDAGSGLAIDSSSNAYVTGQTASSNFPTTTGAFDETYNLGYDAFVTKLDILAPTTTLETSPPSPDGTNGWFKTTPSITLTRNEPGITYYSWNSSTGPWTTYSVPFNAPEGQNTLYYYSVDTAGNAETVKSQLFKVDTGLPTDPTVASSSHTVGGWSNDNTVDVTWFGATDAVSGVDGYSFSWTKDTTAIPDQIIDSAIIDLSKPTLAAAGLHAVGLKDDGTVIAVGENSFYGPLNVSSWTGIKAIATGTYHTVGLKEDGTVMATHAHVPSWWTDIKAIAAGGMYTVGIEGDGTVVAAGSNSYGQLNVSSWTGIKAIAAGEFHTVGLKGDGTVVAVGWNDFGQTNVSSWTGIKAIAAGGYHTVGLKEDGTVVAVGRNDYGQTNVSSWTGIKAIAAGGYHTVGLKDDGTVVAVGENSYGPLNVSSWTGIKAIAAGMDHTVGLKEDGTVVAVGRNDFGQTNVSSWTGIRQPSHTTTSASLADGTWYFHLRTGDWAGNWTSTVHVGPFIIDTVAPTTSLSTLPIVPGGTNGWFKTTPSITLTRDEPGTTYYSWNSSTGPWTTYSVPFNAPEGQNTLYYYSVDTAGNVETVKSQLFKVDTGTPFSTITSPTNGALIKDIAYTITGTASDPASSGVAKVEISMNNGPWQLATGTASWNYPWPLPPDGSYNIKSRATDNAGNMETPGVGVNVTVDNLWAQVNTDGFGNPGNRASFPAAVFNGYLYTDSWNDSGCGVWRTPDGSNWTQIVSGGMGGNPNNIACWAGPAVPGYLIGGVHNEIQGSEVFRSTDGVNFTQVSSFNNPNVPGLAFGAFFNGYWYAGSWDTPTGAKIWRTADYGNTWTQVNVDGFGDPNTLNAMPSEIFNGYLYAGTRNQVAGGALWRTLNGTDWSEVTVGFDKSTNKFVSSIKVFNGYLYIGTGGSTGGEIWRSPDGNNWTQVNADGFGDPNNGIAPNGFLMANGYLYASTVNGATGGEIWRTVDGTNWTQVASGGFGDANNHVVRHMRVFNGKLYVGTRNNVTGGEIWAMPLDTTPPVTSLSSNPPAPDGTNGWFKTTPSIILTRNEPGTTYYSWTSATGPWTTYSAPFNAPEGQDTLYFYSVDTAGNAEAVKSQLFKVDTQAPASFTPNVPADGATVNKPYPYFSWNASSDSTSGLAKYQLYIDGSLSRDDIVNWTAAVPSTALANGSHTWFVRTQDQAGNYRDSFVRSLTVDSGPGKIAFTSVRDGNPEIYIMNADGSNQTRLTNNTAVENFPVLSPDGSKIVFSSNRDGNDEVYVMNSDGTNQTRIMNNAAWDGEPVFTPDGSQIVFESNRTGDYEIYRMNLDGSNQVQLTSGGSHGSPAVSPDGRKIVYGAGDLWIMDIDGSNQTRLTTNSLFDDDPNFSPDGQRITWTITTASGYAGPWEIYIMNADGSNQQNLTNNPASDWYPAFSPGGSRIVFASDRNGNDDIYTMNTDGSGLVRLTNNPANDGWPSWGPGSVPAPPFNLTSPADGATVWNTQPTFSWEPTLDVSKYQLFVDGVLNRDNISSSATSARPTTPLSQGPHTWYVKAIDALGNVRNSTSIRTVVIDPTSQTWAQVDLDGFGDASNTLIYPWEVFNGYLYTGTDNMKGGEVWRSADGINWTKTNINGFGNPNNVMTLPRVVFGGYLYAGTHNEINGAEIWRSLDGINWTQVTSFNNPTVPGAGPEVVSNGYLYAGSWGAQNGGKIWRTLDGTTWTQVNIDGFGDVNNQNVIPTVVFNNYLYARTGNNVTGGEIWRTADGTNWTQVNTDGFGNTNNRGIPSMAIFGGYLYAATGNPTGTQIWRSTDGTNWSLVISGGFGDSNNDMGGNSLFVYSNALYASTRNNATGAEVWRSTDGVNWTQINTDGFGDPNNHMARHMIDFGGKLYLGVRNGATGGEVWALQVPLVDTTPPTTTLSTFPLFPDGTNGWFKTTPSITLSRNETGTTYYKWEYQPGWTTYVGSFNAPEGQHTLYYYSVDTAGNPETVKSAAFKVDSQPPTTPPNVKATPMSSSQIDLSWDASADASSGVAGYKIYNADTNVEIATTISTSYSFTGLNPDTIYRYYVKAQDRAGNLSSPSTVVQAATYKAPVLTSTGTNVPVDLGNNTTLNFEQVTGLGTTSVTVSETAPGPPPGGFSFLGYYYDFSTTATYLGKIRVTFPYDETQIQGAEENLRLFHWENGVWTDVTVLPVDTVNNRITGEVTSLSPFALGMPSGPPSPVPTGLNTYWLLVTSIFMMVGGGYLLARGKKRFV